MPRPYQETCPYQEPRWGEGSDGPEQLEARRYLLDRRT
jgi:hypothetical protein